MAPLNLEGGGGHLGTALDAIKSRNDRMRRRNFISVMLGALAVSALPVQAQDSRIRELETVTVHSDEDLPVEYGPETHYITEPIELPDGKRLIYFKRKAGMPFEQGAERGPKP